MQDPYKYFRLEARELLERFGSGVLELEKGGSGAALVQRLLRYAHTLKGAARVVRQEEIADHAHAIEDVLAPFRDSSDSMPQDSIDAILRHLDAVDSHVLALASTEPAVAATQSTPASSDDIPTIRADVGDMDALLDGVSEAQALLNGLRVSARPVERAQHLADLLLAQLAPHRIAASDAQQMDRAYSMAQELWRSVAGLERNLGATVDQMDRELRQLRDAAEQLRLVSAATLLVSLERATRDAAQALGKQVIFAGTGGHIRLDAHVLGGIQGALVQIIRNAVAHGIESEAARRAAGKPAAGRVTVGISRRAGRLIIECRDDGRGVDLDAVRRIALRQGMVQAYSEKLGAEDLVRLLLRGGISTADVVTKVSGRGVGLDIVRDAMARLGGDVAVRIENGRGTTFEFAVPLTIASMETLAIEVDGTTMTIPLDAVEGALRIAATSISRTSAGAAMVYERETIPFMPLLQALNGTQSATGRNWSAVVLAGAGGRAAIGVDRLLGVSRTVVRPLPDHVSASDLVAGASLDSEGNPQLVLNTDSLVAVARRGDTDDVPPVPIRRPVLVVDDSLTTRMLEQSILESAGYVVDAATSGEEALECARRRRYALFLVDVEMPGMDGFTFVEHTRTDPALHNIPAILMTSRSAPEDRQRGRDVGARGYMIKSEFDQAQLLTMISTLTG